jgi:hypothetical protein
MGKYIIFKAHAIFNYTDDNPDLYKIFEEEAIRAGLQVKRPPSRNIRKGKTLKTSTSRFYRGAHSRLREQRRRRMPKDIDVGNIGSIKKIQFAQQQSSGFSKLGSPISVPKMRLKKNQTNNFQFKSQERDNLLPKVDHGNVSSPLQKSGSSKLPALVLNTARANPDHLAFDTISEQKDDFKSKIKMKRTNSKFSKTGDDEYEKKTYHKSHYADSKNNDDNTNSVYKRSHGAKHTSLSKQSTKPISVSFSKINFIRGLNWMKDSSDQFVAEMDQKTCIPRIEPSIKPISSYF